MAEKDNLDLGEDQKSSRKWLIITSVVAILLLGGGAALYLNGMLHFGKDSAKSNAEEEVDSGESQPSKDAKFYKFEPFVVNFPADSDAQLLQIGFSVLTYDEQTAQAMEKHAPMLRNNLLLLLGRYRPQDLQSVEGKEALRQAITGEIQKVLELRTESGGRIESVFFTQFVMQ
ncbi:flagellar basal body-associated FliL family protein [Methylohalobius crimeensis]|uniref:flagellar basal body-associated FliL family protein n=1 Tax=Methylohalobius crimeensis TaxID=244365 RepID=UPI0003B5CC09|nr:flagellar basal body-associated FliL family protein [Methylohalobius crimeensis]